MNKMTVRTIIFAESKRYSIENNKIEMDSDNIDFLTQQETTEKQSQQVTSSVWIHYRRILVREPKELVENYVWCVHCKQMTAYYGSTTTRLQDHIKKC